MALASTRVAGVFRTSLEDNIAVAALREVGGVAQKDCLW